MILPRASVSARRINEVIDEIVDLADIYLKDMHFPDKAIDVLDNTLVSCEKPIKKEKLVFFF